MSTRTLPDVPAAAADVVARPSSTPAACSVVVAELAPSLVGGKQSLLDETISRITADSHVDNIAARGFAAALAATAAATASAAGSARSPTTVLLWLPGR